MHEFDLIIIGGGPSSAGLLRGILIHMKEHDINLHIAVIERGGYANEDLSTLSFLQALDVHHESTAPLRDWFAAAHYSSTNKTVLHASLPQTHLHNRIVDVPTGKGWGGSTNIHAGLFVPPPAADFDSWPRHWKRRMMSSVEHVVNAFQKQGAVETTPCRNNEAEIQEVKIEPVTTSSIQTNRVGYYSVLVKPLLDESPWMRECIAFLSGMEVERILIGSAHNENVNTSCTGSTSCARAWGVECLATTNTSSSGNNSKRADIQRRVVLKAKSQIILCAGAIGSPSLLLASGIGHEHDLKAANITPWYKDSSFEHTHFKMSDRHSHLAVGRNLRDHILVPRIFLKNRKEDENDMSSNSIRGTWTVQLPMQHDDDEFCAKYQIQLADGIAVEKMIPHFGAGPIRRGWSVPCFGYEVPSVWVSIAFYSLRRVLHFILCHTPGLLNWLYFHFASINVCLMNPKSVGHVRLVRRYTEGMTSNKTPCRLSDFEVAIDPGYLSNSHDRVALLSGWEAAATLKDQCGDMAEVLPGYCFVILFKIYNILSWALGWMRMLLFLGNTRNVISSTQLNSSFPSWFDTYIAEFAVPYYHWFGTCAMGPVPSSISINDDNDANHTNNEHVVDEFLRLRGISGLCVCDASVFPCITVPTALTCAALGHASAEFILAEMLDA
jgi:choline dehydrogenase-like flavoprotein